MDHHAHYTCSRQRSKSKRIKFDGPPKVSSAGTSSEQSTTPGRSISPFGPLAHEPTERQKEEMAKQKKQYCSDEVTLSLHLNTLSLGGLAPYLVWVPPGDFRNREFICQGGFAAVEKATVDVKDEKGVKINEVVVALKNMKYPLTEDLKNERN
ncbi:hypothetical protein BC938DRAFT_479380 [Jimgerdemannia flammicorona]|uniref:Uncharacterized protein n=1 Tax=Jimgerdemannia flammicorona TaxID=994334 RepID=A0A433QL10_9FUNG|nr:hypothetical protein BC938DRAFT_479380 [Jimgerdemannia flammicorona]